MLQSLGRSKGPVSGKKTKRAPVAALFSLQSPVMDLHFVVVQAVLPGRCVRPILQKGELRPRGERAQVFETPSSRARG